MDSSRKNLVVVFFSDRWMLYGLHAALASLLAHAKQVRLNVIVFSDGLTKREKKLLEKTAGTFIGGHSFEIRDLQLQWPEGTPTLRGNMTANARIFLPSLLPDQDEIVYLDSDIIVQRDVGELLETGDACPLKAVDFIPDEGHNDFTVLRAHVTAPDNVPRMFNSGVFVASLDKWRILGLQQKCVDLLVRLAKAGCFLDCPDQTILNIVFHGRWQCLDSTWNAVLRPHQPKVVDATDGKKIWHMLSVPKPWYPLGRLAYGNSHIWHAWHKKTALARSPLSWVINYLTPRWHYIAFASTTLRLIFARARGDGQ